MVELCLFARINMNPLSPIRGGRRNFLFEFVWARSVPFLGEEWILSRGMGKSCSLFLSSSSSSYPSSSSLCFFSNSIFKFFSLSPSEWVWRRQWGEGLIFSNDSTTTATRTFSFVYQSERVLLGRLLALSPTPISISMPLSRF